MVNIDKLKKAIMEYVEENKEELFWAGVILAITTMPNWGPLVAGVIGSAKEIRKVAKKYKSSREEDQG